MIFNGFHHFFRGFRTGKAELLAEDFLLGASPFSYEDSASLMKPLSVPGSSGTCTTRRVYVTGLDLYGQGHWFI